MTQPPDVIDLLAGIAAGSALDNLRRQQPEVVRYSQGSYDILLEPGDPTGLSRAERELVALRVATLIGNTALAEHHQARLRQLDASNTMIVAAKSEPDATGLGPRAAAILRHVDLLSSAPDATSPAALEELRANRLSTPEIVTLAQLIAFVHFQARVLAGLRLLAEESR